MKDKYNGVIEWVSLAVLTIIAVAVTLSLFKFINNL